MDSENYQLIERIARDNGMVLFGVASLDFLRQKYGEVFTLGGDLSYGISLGYHLSERIVSDITDHPTKIYLYHYRQVNHLLDHTALKITSFIQEKGFTAIPIPSSQIADWQKQIGHLSHKQVGYAAGLGWIGRNTLLVNPKYGAKVRYTTILTDFPLKVDKPYEGDCGTCRACIEVCPAGAIGEKPEEFNLEKCSSKLKEFAKKVSEGIFICGICVKACPGHLE